MHKFMKFFLISSLFSVLFSSCMDPVFPKIKREVSLEKFSMPGICNSVVRYGDNYLVSQTGKGVFYKISDTERTGSDSVWNERGNKTFDSLAYNYKSAKYEGEYIYKVSADSDYIYILTASVVIDTDEGEVSATSGDAKRTLYCTNNLGGNTWTKIKTWGSASSAALTTFCTNTVKKENRKAYLRYGSTVYELSGATFPASPTSTEKSYNSCVYFDGDVKFFNSLASTTNETKNADATKYYYADDKGGNIIYWDGAEEKTIESSGTISAMAVTKDYLLVGKGSSTSSTSTDGGIYRMGLDSNGIPSTKLIDKFETNADAVFTSSYQILTLLVVDSSKTETNSIIYASTNFKTAGGSISVSYDNLGVWAYYPKRGNWNRE